jgi:hypothetical protein
MKYTGRAEARTGTGDAQFAGCSCLYILYRLIQRVDADKTMPATHCIIVDFSSSAIRKCSAFAVGRMAEVVGVVET